MGLVFTAARVFLLSFHSLHCHLGGGYTSSSLLGNPECSPVGCKQSETMHAVALHIGLHVCMLWKQSRCMNAALCTCCSVCFRFTLTAFVYGWLQRMWHPSLLQGCMLGSAWTFAGCLSQVGRHFFSHSWTKEVMQMHVTQVTLCPFCHGCRHCFEKGASADSAVCCPWHWWHSVLMFGVCVPSPFWPIACWGNVECKLHMGLVNLSLL